MESNENVAKTYTDPVTGKFVTGNPGGGRPRGSISIKDKVRQHLETHPEDVEEIVSHFVKNNRELMWQMMEGRPHQSGDVEVKLPQFLVDLIKDGAPEQETSTDVH